MPIQAISGSTSLLEPFGFSKASQTAAGRTRSFSVSVRRLCSALIALVTIAIGMPGIAAASSFNTKAPSELTCNAMHNPLGIDVLQPRLSWQLQDARRGAKQTGYEIRVASSRNLLAQGHADIWDSGRVRSDQSVGIVYAGPELKSRRRYYWQVRIWDQNREPSAFSEASWWEMGLLSSQDWKAKWITRDTPIQLGDYKSDPKWIGALDKAGKRHFRVHFNLSDTPKDAVLFITGKDNSRAWVNGKQVLEYSPSRDYAGPFLRKPWGTFRVIRLNGILRKGENVIAAEVEVQSAGYGALIAMLRAQMPDGKVERFVTGPHWKTAQRATGQWFEPSFDDSAWTQAAVIEKGAEFFGLPWPAQPASLLRRAFTTSKSIRSARIYSTALGSYRLYLNGHPVGKDILAPGWTDYRKHIVYQVYDVTSQLVKGKNALGVILGGGWYADAITWWQTRYNFGPPPVRVLLQLEIEYTDGTRQSIVTDGSWRAAQSPIVRSGLYSGEHYDARLEQSGWDQPNFSDGHWQPAFVAAAPSATLVAQDFQPIRVEQIIEPKAVTNPSPGVYVFDLGQNIAGVERLTIPAGPAGTEVRLRFGEVLKSDGNVYTKNQRTAENTDTYILNGKADGIFDPDFTYRGFRYIEMTGYPGVPPKDAIQGIVFHTDAPFTIHFHTSNDMLNRLWSNILWSQRANLQSLPTDCPQRDERLGWMGDAELFWRTASFNQNLDAFAHKFTTDIRDSQVSSGAFTDVSPAFGLMADGAPGWADAGVIIPWTTYVQYGDISILRENWPTMEKWMDHLERANPNHLWLNDRGYDYGDWLAIGSTTPKELIATAFWANDSLLMMRMAHALNLTKDAEKYSRLFNEIRDAFDRRFVKDDGIVGSGSQTSDVLALHMNLIPDNLRSKVVNRLVEDIQAHDGHLTTGLLGTTYLMSVLSDNGQSATAYNLLLGTTFPSWGYEVEHGATTIWERWNGNQMLHDPSMNSFNQYVFGAVGEWLYRYAAGIDEDPDDPGFHRVILHPEFDTRIGSVSATYDSPYGPIVSKWTNTGSVIRWNVSIPPNSTGLIYLPSGRRVSEEGRELPQIPGMTFVRKHDGRNIFAVESGSYHFDIGR